MNIRDEEIGALIRKYRYAAGLSQPQLAEVLDVVPMMIQKYESGKSSIRAKDLAAIAARMGCKTVDLLPKRAR